MAFSFLVDDYDYRILTKKRTAEGCRFVFMNAAVGVTVSYEIREGYINVLLHRLVKGAIKFDPWPYERNRPLNNIGLDWIVKYKDESKLSVPLYDPTSEYYNNTNAFNLMISKVAQNLRIFGDSVLRGNFGIFAEVDHLLKDHYKN